MSVACTYCDTKFSKQYNLNRHLDGRCYKKPSLPQIQLKSTPPTTESITSVSNNDTMDPDIRHQLQELTAMVKQLMENSQKPSTTNIIGHGNVINSGVINNTASLQTPRPDTFDDKCFNLGQHILDLNSGDLTASLRTIYNLVKTKRTTRTKFDFPNLNQLFPKQAFDNYIKPLGKDESGDYKYECLDRGAKKILTTIEVDKIFTAIITNAAYLCNGMAIHQSLNSYEKNHKKSDLDGGASSYLMDYGGAYGNPDDDINNKIAKFRALSAEKVHICRFVSSVLQIRMPSNSSTFN
jgi:hypothetical protein